MLKPRVFPDHESASRFATDWLAEQLRSKPSSLLCLATGHTPMRTYQLLAECGKTEPELFDRVRLLNLDEWSGLDMDDPATCGRHLRDVLVTPLKLIDRYVAFESRPADAPAECARVAAWLKKNGPIDACLLGLGLNGHLGFNEPAESLQPHSHVARLSNASLSHTMIGNSATRPTDGLTLGMAELMHSRRVLLLATGESKREPLRRLLSGEITTAFPASLLQLHPDSTIACDAAASPG